AAAGAGTAARSARTHRVRAGATGKRPVGWAGSAARLLRAGNHARPAGLGLRRARPAGRLDAARTVRMSRQQERIDSPGGGLPRARETTGRVPAANDDLASAHDLPAYAELHCLSDCSFLRGAASAEELFARAHHCGYEALAITDECSL